MDKITLTFTRRELEEYAEILREFRTKPGGDLSLFRRVVDNAVLDLLVHINGKLAERS